MDQELLVERIEDGHRLIVELLRDGFDVTVAFWARTSEDGVWLFYVSSDAVDVKKVAEAYRRVFASINRLGTSWVSPAEMKLIHPSNPISVAAILARDHYASNIPTRLHDKRLGTLRVHEAYIYPRERWFKGFEDIKKHYPSAEIFTFRILAEDLFAKDALRLINRINARMFEGKAPGTVLFMGPQGSSGKALAEFLFVYRPEGWNTLYRAETNSWEKVIHVETGKELYEAADFGPLLDLKTEQNPAARELEIIKRRMLEGGFYLTIPPDPTPIYSIPFTPSVAPDRGVPTPIDWEMIRRIMEAGGTIVINRIPTEVNV